MSKSLESPSVAIGSHLAAARLLRRRGAGRDAGLRRACWGWGWAATAACLLFASGCEEASNASTTDVRETEEEDAGSIDAGDVAADAMEPDAVNDVVPTERLVEGNVESTVAAGFWHACALSEDGVDCWGRSSDIGFFPTNQNESQTGDFVQVSVGQWHSCALRADGGAHCWGDDREGQSSAPFGAFVQVVAGGKHSCGLHADGTVSCWGIASEPSGHPDPDLRFVQLSAGTKWHDWNYAETCGLTFAGDIVCWSTFSQRNYDLPPGPYTQISLGLTHLCGLHESGRVFCSQCDAGFCTAETFEGGQSNALAGTYLQVSSGGIHTCALLETGFVECWGFDSGDRRTMPPNLRFAEVSAGSYNSCGRTQDGQLECWGTDTARQSSPP